MGRETAKTYSYAGRSEIVPGTIIYPEKSCCGALYRYPQHRYISINYWFLVFVTKLKSKSMIEEDNSREIPGEEEKKEASGQFSEEKKENFEYSEEEKKDRFDQAEEEKETKPEDDFIHRLTRSRRNKLILGVCGGLGEYFNVDPVFIRIIFLLSFLLGGWGFLLYIFAGIIMPAAPYVKETEQPVEENKGENTRFILGFSLILFGAYLFIRTTGFLHLLMFNGIRHDIIMPVFLIIIGSLFVFRYGEIVHTGQQEPGSRRLYRSVKNVKIAGVCGGLAEYLGADPTLIRILWLVLTFASIGLGVLIYIIFALVVPKENRSQSE